MKSQRGNSNQRKSWLALPVVTRCSQEDCDNEVVHSEDVPSTYFEWITDSVCADCADAEWDAHWREVRG